MNKTRLYNQRTNLREVKSGIPHKQFIVFHSQEKQRKSYTVNQTRKVPQPPVFYKKGCS